MKYKVFGMNKHISRTITQTEYVGYFMTSISLLWIRSHEHFLNTGLSQGKIVLVPLFIGSSICFTRLAYTKTSYKELPD